MIICDLFSLLDVFNLVRSVTIARAQVRNQESWLGTQELHHIKERGRFGNSVGVHVSMVI